MFPRSQISPKTEPRGFNPDTQLLLPKYGRARAAPNGTRDAIVSLAELLAAHVSMISSLIKVQVSLQKFSSIPEVSRCFRMMLTCRFSLHDALFDHELERKRKANLAAMLEALLDDVVAKHILHKGDGMRLHLLKHCHYLLWWSVCQLLLYEATAVLIPAEVMHITFDVLHHIVTDNLVMSN